MTHWTGANREKASVLVEGVDADVGIERMSSRRWLI